MSQLYARVFVQILDSSIAENFTLRHVFEDFFKLCDHKTGIVDMTRQAISRRLNIPLEQLNKHIKLLESPDPSSRDQEHEGRRIERLDEHRDWGWKILNWEKYEEIKTKSDVARRVSLHRKREQEPISIPASLNTPEFLKAWAEWNQHRVEKKKPQTNLSCQKQLKFLESIGIQRAIAAINFSIEKGWEGIYEQKENGAPSRNGNGGDQFWKLTKELELVEKEISTIRNRASQTATGVVIDERDKDAYNRLRNRRSEIKSKLQLR